MTNVPPMRLLTQAGTRPPLSVTLVRPLPTGRASKDKPATPDDGQGRGGGGDGQVDRGCGTPRQVDPVGEEGKLGTRARKTTRALSGTPDDADVRVA